jgi:twitching motility protein PilT
LNFLDQGHSDNVELAALNSALSLMIDLGASDLHLSAGVFMVRVDGALRPLDGFETWSEAQVSSALQAITPAKRWHEFQDELELDQSYTLPESGRFRVNLYFQKGRLGAAFRAIPTRIKSVQELSLPESITNFSNFGRGLVLVTGPTGSGKSTTLAALINEINLTRDDHIMTIEDPIEFVHESKRALINQRETGADTKSFQAALKHVLRQDPDVILIGEMRDLETISAALTAAETGHLVFGTLHTQSAAQTVDRIIDVFPPHQQSQVRTMLATTLKGIVCQNLIPAVNGGRVAATEILVSNPAISNLIREGKTFQIPSAIQGGREQGMQSMDQALAGFVKNGVVAPEVARDAAHDPASFSMLIPGYGV